ncbi:hypothetical protein QMK17_08265 [Rhodococcus sp. G-MC3]|uniref:Rv0361 family membrane protein n=1 Tax=Rhodococcus sp. G-MC3 TaxID=3046209 RepID=UPI0024BAB022|nr:hypothetical protein [Rhodococcus sp. G-MC3]MDJ0393325.1 hypothetical protein [Rhodococcus sp. G-MC3]
MTTIVPRHSMPLRPTTPLLDRLDASVEVSVSWEPAVSEDKHESKTGADEPATEAIPSQKPVPTVPPETTAPEPADTKEASPPENETVAIEVIPVEAVPVEATPIEAIAPGVRPPARKPHAEPRRIPARGEDPSPQRNPAPQATPQRVGPPTEESGRHGGRRWLAALIAALAVIVAAGIAGYFYLSKDYEETSPDAQIRTTIQSFTQALSSGDLATLRTSSCGDLATYYRDIPDAEFTDVHRVAVEQGNIPVVDGVDAVQITGDTAIAQVIAFTAANPNERSARTFDLQLEGEDWKVCSPA